MKDFDFEFIEEAVEVGNRYRYGKYSSVIRDWLASSNKTLKFKFSNENTAKNCAGACRETCKKLHEDYTVYRRQCEVYLIRA